MLPWLAACCWPSRFGCWKTWKTAGKRTPAKSSASRVPTRWSTSPRPGPSSTIRKHPDVSVQVLGGGSGVGIASLIDGNCDMANTSRKMKPDEIERAESQPRRRAQGNHRRLRRPGHLRPQGQSAGFDLDGGIGRDLRRGRQDRPSGRSLGVTDGNARPDRNHAGQPAEQFRHLRLLPRGRAGAGQGLTSSARSTRAARRTWWPWFRAPPRPSATAAWATARRT